MEVNVTRTEHIITAHYYTTTYGCNREGQPDYTAVNPQNGARSQSSHVAEEPMVDSYYQRCIIL